MVECCQNVLRLIAPINKTSNYIIIHWSEYWQNVFCKNLQDKISNVHFTKHHVVRFFLFYKFENSLITLAGERDHYYRWNDQIRWITERGLCQKCQFIVCTVVSSFIGRLHDNNLLCLAFFASLQGKVKTGEQSSAISYRLQVYYIEN